MKIETNAEVSLNYSILAYTKDDEEYWKQGTNVSNLIDGLAKYMAKNKIQTSDLGKCYMAVDHCSLGFFVGKVKINTNFYPNDVIIKEITEMKQEIKKSKYYVEFSKKDISSRRIKKLKDQQRYCVNELYTIQKKLMEI